METADLQSACLATNDSREQLQNSGVRNTRDQIAGGSGRFADGWGAVGCSLFVNARRERKWLQFKDSRCHKVHLSSARQRLPWAWREYRCWPQRAQLPPRVVPLSLAA